MKRSGYLPRRNAARAVKAFIKAYGSEAFVRWMRTQRCIVCRERPSLAAHVTRTKKNGGGPENCAPLCFDHHNEEHQGGGQTFQREHGISFEEAATENWRRWNKHLDFTGRL